MKKFIITQEIFYTHTGKVYFFVCLLTALIVYPLTTSNDYTALAVFIVTAIFLILDCLYSQKTRDYIVIKSLLPHFNFEDQTEDASGDLNLSVFRNFFISESSQNWKLFQKIITDKTFNEIFYPSFIEAQKQVLKWCCLK